MSESDKTEQVISLLKKMVHLCTELEIEIINLTSSEEAERLNGKTNTLKRQIALLYAQPAKDHSLIKDISTPALKRGIKELRLTTGEIRHGIRNRENIEKAHQIVDDVLSMTGGGSEDHE